MMSIDRSSTDTLSLQQQQTSGGAYQLDSQQSTQRLKDPTLTLKLPSISTRPRRATYSHEIEPCRIRSCLRGPSRNHGFRGTVVSPTLMPLAEVSTPPPATCDFNVPAALGASMAIANSACPLAPHTPSHSEPSISNPSPPSLWSNPIYPTSYFTRRRGASLSPSIASTSSHSRDSAITTSPQHSPTLTKSSYFSGSTFNSSQTYPTQTPAERPVLHTIPLRSCCKDCIATLEAHPSALLPVASEANAHWTYRARAKKVADEREEEAVRAAASESAKANMGCIMRLWGEKPASHLQNNRDVDKAQGLELATVKLRSPLTPESLRRNRELRASFNSELDATLRDQLASAETSPKTGDSEGGGRSVGHCCDGNPSSPDEDLKDRVDLGVHAVRRHSQLGSRPEDLFDEEDEDEIDETTEVGIDGDTEPDDEEQREDAPTPAAVNRKDGQEVGTGAPAAPPSPRSLPLERTPPPRTLIRGGGPNAGKGSSSLDTYLSSTKPATTPNQSLEPTYSSRALAPSSNKSTFRRPGISRSASEGGVAPPTSFKIFSSPQSGGNGGGNGFMNILRRRASKETLPSPSTSSTRMKTASASGTLNILSSLGRLPGVGA